MHDKNAWIMRHDEYGTNCIWYELQIYLTGTGANNYFAQVLFEENKTYSHYMGGKVVKDKNERLPFGVHCGDQLLFGDEVNFLWFNPSM